MISVGPDIATTSGSRIDRRRFGRPGSKDSRVVRSGQPGARRSVAGLTADNAAASDSCGDPFVATVVAPGHGSNRSRIAAPISGVASDGSSRAWLRREMRRAAVSGSTSQRSSTRSADTADASVSAAVRLLASAHEASSNTGSPSSRSRRARPSSSPYVRRVCSSLWMPPIQGVADLFQVADPGEILPDLVGAQQRPTEGISDSGRKRRFP